MSTGDGDIDFAAAYLQHRVAMYRVAVSVLREVGRESEAEDVVSDAVVSLLASPPEGVRNWEALLVTVVKRKALDRVRSAEVRKAGPPVDLERDDPPSEDDVADEVVSAIDRSRLAGVAWDGLSTLDERSRFAVWSFAALGRPRADIATDLGVSPGRVSQMVTAALQKLRAYVEGQTDGRH